MGGWMELDPRVGTETRDQSDAVLIVNTEELGSEMCRVVDLCQQWLTALQTNFIQVTK